jgi:protein-tyrosine-phosphatase
MTYLLFLCQHGILRSAYAKAVAKKYAEKYKLDWKIDFGGLYDEGSIGPGILGTLLTQAARRSFLYTLISVNDNQLNHADVIYVMTEDMRTNLIRRNPGLSGKIRCLGLPDDLLTSFVLNESSKKKIRKPVFHELRKLRLEEKVTSQSSP